MSTMSRFRSKKEQQTRYKMKWCMTELTASAACTKQLSSLRKDSDAIKVFGTIVHTQVLYAWVDKCMFLCLISESEKKN